MRMCIAGNAHRRSVLFSCFTHETFDTPALSSQTTPKMVARNMGSGFKILHWHGHPHPGQPEFAVSVAGSSASRDRRFSVLTASGFRRIKALLGSRGPAPTTDKIPASMSLEGGSGIRLAAADIEGNLSKWPSRKSSTTFAWTIKAGPG
jgi:hypothetical protein